MTQRKSVSVHFFTNTAQKVNGHQFPPNGISPRNGERQCYLDAANKQFGGDG